MGRQKSATSHTTVAEAPQKEAKLAWKLESEKLLDTFKTMKKKKIDRVDDEGEKEELLGKYLNIPT